MPGLRDTLNSPALSLHCDRLRAIFAPITAEIRKGGRVLTDDEGSFYQSDSFRWKFYLKDFLDSYHAICNRKQVDPIYLDPKLKAALKVPFADIGTLRLLQDSVVKRLLQFRERRVSPFSGLPAYPTSADISTARNSYRDDKDIYNFLGWCYSLPNDLSAYVRSLEKLSGAYEQRINAYIEALKPGGSDEKAKAKLNESKQKTREILDPYIRHLKSIGAIPKSWTYSFKGIPLTEAERIGKESRLGVSKSNLDYITKHWESDTLPSPAKVELSAEAKNRYMSELFAAAKKASDREIMEVEERAKPEPKSTPKPVFKPTPKPVEKKTKIKVRHYRKPLWTRFDDWVRRIGDWFAYKMDDISDWMMTAWVFFFIAYVLIGIIAVWVNEGFFSAVLAVFVILFVVGLLGGLIETIAGLIALIVKYVTYVPLFILRCIFYRGWTLLLILLTAVGFVAYKILEMNYII